MQTGKKGGEVFCFNNRYFLRPISLLFVSIPFFVYPTMQRFCCLFLQWSFLYFFLPLTFLYSLFFSQLLTRPFFFFFTFVQIHTFLFAVRSKPFHFSFPLLLLHLEKMERIGQHSSFSCRKEIFCLSDNNEPLQNLIFELFLLILFLRLPLHHNWLA